MLAKLYLMMDLKKTIKAQQLNPFFILLLILIILFCGITYIFANGLSSKGVVK